MSSNKRDMKKKRPNATSPLFGIARASNVQSQRSYSQDLTEEVNNEPKTNIKMANKLIVGPSDEADYKTLSEALEVAEPGTIIALEDGYHNVTAKIKTPGLKIES